MGGVAAGNVNKLLTMEWAAVLLLLGHHLNNGSLGLGSGRLGLGQSRPGLGRCLGCLGGTGPETDTDSCLMKVAPSYVISTHHSRDSRIKARLGGVGLAAAGRGRPQIYRAHLREGRPLSYAMPVVPGARLALSCSALPCPALAALGHGPGPELTAAPP